MSSTVVAIPSEEGDSLRVKKKNQFFLSFLHCIKQKKGRYDPKVLIHSIKVGIALVLVSLLYLVDPLYEQVGENAMWAIMTVVVVFEFTAGAVLSKGVNRALGTVLGGGLGCLAAMLAQEIGGIGRAIIVGISVFIFGAAASYSRLVPSIKRKYDYGVMIFLLTFNLVVVSGLRSEEVIQLARERLSTIVIGFSICIITSFLIFPLWASDELHCSIVTKFENLARSIEGCLEEYFEATDGKKENQVNSSSGGYKSVLYSKSKDETLANFARWEPWHGKFGFYYPWDKYLHIGELLRELAASILSLKGSFQPPQQACEAFFGGNKVFPLFVVLIRLLSGPSSALLRLSVKEPCEVVSSMIARTLRELGDSITNMTRSRSAALIVAKLQLKRTELRVAMLASKLESDDGLEIATLVFMLMDMAVKVEKLVQEVEELGDLARFVPQ
ncbi:Aluminum-activated malate transporter [Macleaya cordata]|uniref:Aluminum-activated malate transporter n=1 Tax=Macleaya cordata TaxID=56857 RepID=A0A200Q5J7_MACCD|nr:Aluminum-activated malate transporter [Macleaya cordata]